MRSLWVIVLILIQICCIGISAQTTPKTWALKFQRGDFDTLEDTLDAVINNAETDHKYIALKLLGDIYKIKGDIETAMTFWKRSDSLLNSVKPNQKSTAIRLGHLSNYYYEKFNSEKTKLYNDSLITIMKSTPDLALSDIWILNVVAQSNKLGIDRKINCQELIIEYEDKVFPYYTKSINEYQLSNGSVFQLAKTYHLFANACVDVVHALKSDNNQNSLLESYQRKANEFYDKAIDIYTTNFGKNHYEIARALYVKSLLYIYANPEPNHVQFEESTALFEKSLLAFHLKRPEKIINISEALGCAKQYQKTLYFQYRIAPNQSLKFKMDSIFYLSKNLWKHSLETFKTKNVNQLLSLYGLSPYSERINQLYFEFHRLKTGDIDTIFECLQNLKYLDKQKWNNTLNLKRYTKKELQGQLNSGQCFLEFTSSPVPFVLMISEDTCEIIQLNIDQNDIEILRKAIENMDFTEYVHSAQILYKKLFKDLTIRQFNSLIISPYSWFNKIPFNALLLSNKAIELKDYRKLDYLLHHIDIEYIFSPRDIFENQKLKSGFKVDLFAPTYSIGEALPFAQKFAKTFKYDHKAYIGVQASKSNFLNSENPILHYSGHGKASAVQRESSVIKLGDDALNLEDVYTSHFKSDLVVLNACSSGKGFFNEGDGADGFPRAFYMKGTRQVLSSFWNLDDRSSHLIISNFYENLSNGMGTQNALRNSQVSYISNARNSNIAAPYYWAGHQLQGKNQSFSTYEKNSIGISLGYKFWAFILSLSGLIIYSFFRIRKASS